MINNPTSAKPNFFLSCSETKKRTVQNIKNNSKIHNPLTEGPSSIGLPIRLPNSCENRSDNFCIACQRNGILSTKTMNKV